MPSKRKRQKTAAATTTATRTLTQAEIWDDSALIRSWNDALAEYEYYHSIHARGEDVEEILRKAEAGELDDGDDQQTSAASKSSHSEDGAPTTAAAHGINGRMKGTDEAVTRAETADGVGDDEAEEGELVEEEDETVAANARRGPFATKLNVGATATAPMIGPGQPPGHADMSLHPAATDNVADEKGPPKSAAQDQTLENIKMAYYWAGYYSGLYDGQRQAQSQTQ
ncbi:hypothetical protein G647_06183 [Cladophialophora carrionii CBS 160.54]|uniref:Survival Motor Neuron Gemin2-binding domain-containing protein n=1 Tax=Cladophialophora carrionii CBS 160.54 TaxID=1279043 RepID=V9D624_9EURO|nr:uncharacterized protein G647_06183 [Cladophialophora carrionii CBS 160.54]ETI22111.1 hypothetical protein G647_06183 [Cladophialophora carrionii CBS 160.54]